MTNEELLEKILNNTIERIVRQAKQYEAEIANLTSQTIILSAKVQDLELTINTKNAKGSSEKTS